jgi:hypothetical protein
MAVVEEDKIGRVTEHEQQQFLGKWKQFVEDGVLGGYESIIQLFVQICANINY